MVQTSTFKVTLKRFASGEVVVEMSDRKGTIEHSFRKADDKWGDAYNAVVKIIKKK